MKRLGVAVTLAAAVAAFFVGRLATTTAVDAPVASQPKAEQPRPLATHPEGGYVLPFTGALTNEKGVPIAEGKTRLLFSLFSSANSTEPECSQELTIEVQKNGQFEAQLELDRFSGFNPLIIDGRLLYLGVRVQDKEGADLLTSPEMLPRVCIWPVLYAKNAGRLSNHTWEDIDERLSALERKTSGILDPAPQPKRTTDAKKP